MKTRMIRLIASLVFVTMLFTATGAGFATDETSTVYVSNGDSRIVDGNITTTNYDWGADVRSDYEDETPSSLTVKGNIDSQYLGVVLNTKGGVVILKADQDLSALYEGMDITFSQATELKTNLTQADYEKIKDKLVVIYEYGDTTEYAYYDEETETEYFFSFYQDTFNYGYAEQTLHFPGKIEAVVKGNLSTEGKDNYSGATGINIYDGSEDYDETEITVGGDVKTTANQSYAYGATATIDTGSFSLEIQNGGIIADSENGYATGISLQISSSDKDEEDSAASIAVAKDVNATGPYGATGFGGTIENAILVIDFGGDVSAESDKERAYALKVSTVGDESKASITVSGDVSAIGNEQYYYSDGTSGVEITNQGGQAEVEIAGDVISNKTGIMASNRAYSTSIYLDQDDVEAMMDKLELISDDGYTKTYVYEDEKTGDTYRCYVLYSYGYAYGYRYITRDYQGATSISVDGSVASEGKKDVTGVNASSANGNSIEVSVGEDVMAVSEESSATGATVSITGADDRESIAEFSVGGDLIAEGVSSAVAFSGEAQKGGNLTAVLDGDVTAYSEKGWASGIKIDTWDEDDEVSVVVAGDVSAVNNPDEYYWYSATGIETDNRGGTVEVDVGGDVSSTLTGINATNTTYTKSDVFTKDEFEAMKSKVEFIKREDESGILYSYYDEDTGIYYSYYISTAYGYEYGSISYEVDNEGETAVMVDGSVAAEGKESVTGVYAYSANGNSLGISVGEDVTAESTENSATGIRASIAGEDDRENAATIIVGGDIVAKGQYQATGFTGSSSEGSNLTAELGGKVSAESQKSNATGVSIEAYGSEDGEASTAIFATDGDITAAGEYANAFMGYSDYNSELTATVGGDVASKAQYEANGFGGESRNGSSLTAELGGKVSAESQNSEAKGVSLSAYGSEDGESSTATFATDGDIAAVGGNGATAFRGYSDYGSELTATVGGDVTAEAPKGRVNGISIATKYADNKAEVEVTGDINAALTGDDFWYDTYGINALNNGGDINVKTGGDVTSTGNGIYARNQRFTETKQLTPDDFEAMKDKFRLIWEDDGEKYYTYSDQETGAYYYYHAFDDGSGYGSGSIPKDYEATTTVTVDGAVTAAGKLNTWGINVESGNGNAMDITVGEDVTAESKENSATAIRATITGKDDRANAARITVGGEVAAKGQNGATGFTGYGSSGSSLTAELGGNVSAESQESFATGVSISAYASEDSDESKVVFTTGGDITATGKFSATGFSAESDYGSELTAAVGGGVAAVSKERSATGIRANTSEEDSALKISVGGDLTAQALAATHIETRWVEDEDGEWHEEEYAEDNEAFGGKLVNYGGSINLDVAGNIETNRNSLIVGQGYTTETTDLDEEEAKAILSKATLDYSDTWTDDEGIEHTFEEYSYTDDSGNYYYFEVYDGEFDYGYKEQRVDVKAETNVTVGGNVIAENEDSYANGMILESNNKNGQTVITVGGAVQVSAQDSAIGLSGNTLTGSLQANIAGEVLAESVQSSAYGLFASANGDNASVAFAVDGMVSAAVEKNSEDEDNLAVGVEAQIGNQGGKAEIEVLGGISAEFTETPENAIGIDVNNRPAENKEGVIAILVTGDVESTGNGVNIISASKTDKNGKPVASKEKTDIEIIGDVTAGERGLNLEQAFNTDVIVDGTVSGGKGAVVLRDDTDASSLMLTVWELVPDENGAVITRYDHTVTDEDVEYIEDRELEKEVQYIIHVIQPEKGATLYTEGTEEYEGYLVAHEGDTVYLIADMTPGYRITGAFYDEELTKPMTKEKYNRYFVAVPKGGAVSLSALIERALKLASLKPDYTVTYSEPNDYDEYVEKDRNGSKAERTQIRMNGNGGTVYGQENYFALARNGSTLTLPQPDAREGFTFIGWYPNALANGAAAPGEEELIGANTQVTAGEASVYTAIWKETK